MGLVRLRVLRSLLETSQRKGANDQTAYMATLQVKMHQEEWPSRALMMVSREL